MCPTRAATLGSPFSSHLLLNDGLCAVGRKNLASSLVRLQDATKIYLSSSLPEPSRLICQNKAELNVQVYQELYEWRL